MNDGATRDPKSLPRPQYLPEVGRPARKPVRPRDVPPVPPGMYLPETGAPHVREKK
jgi:hypothetical protein